MIFSVKMSKGRNERNIYLEVLRTEHMANVY